MSLQLSFYYEVAVVKLLEATRESVFLYGARLANER